MFVFIYKTNWNIIKHLNAYWKMFIKYPHLLTGVGRGDNIEAAEKFICLLYGFEERGIRGIDIARHSET